MHPIVKILRPALAPTAAADVLTAAALAGAAPTWTLAAATGASVCIYAGGMAQNDLVDRKRDQTVNPDRPLVQHPELRGPTRLLMLGLFAAGVGLGAYAGAWVAALAVVVCASAYNLVCKSFFPANVMAMASARGANVLFGFIAVTGGIPTYGWLFAGGYAIYIAAVSGASLAEDFEQQPTLKFTLFLAYLGQLVAFVALAFLAVDVTQAMWMLVPAVLLGVAVGPALRVADRGAAQKYVFRSLLAIFVVHGAVLLAAGANHGLIGVGAAGAATFLILCALPKKAP